MFYVEEDIGSLRRVISQHATAKEAMTMAQAYAALHYVKYRWTVDWLYTATPLKDVPRPGARHILARLKNNPNYYSRKSKS